MRYFLSTLLISLPLTLFTVRATDGQNKACSNIVQKLLGTIEPRPAESGRLIPKASEGGITIEALNQGMPRPFKFSGGVELADFYRVSFFHAGTPQAFDVIIPYTATGQQSPGLLEKMREVVGHLSSRLLKEVDWVALSPYPRADDIFWGKGGGGASGSKTVVADITLAFSSDKILLNLYPAGYTFMSREQLISHLHHELGHALAARHFGKFEPGPEWQEAIRADDYVILRNGERISPTEDFAEAVALYTYTEGGTKNLDTLTKLSHRFKILDSLMQVDWQLKSELLGKASMRQMMEKNRSRQIH